MEAAMEAAMEATMEAPAVAAADAHRVPHRERDLNLDLSFLVEHERDSILRVLQKDEKLRKREEKRIRKLKNELLEIKRGSGSRAAAPPRDSPERRCGRCERTLGLILDRGRACRQCRMLVCAQCRAPNGAFQWRCNVCAKISELKVATGEWFLEERSKRFEPKVCSGDAVKQTILRHPPAPEEKTTSDSSSSSKSSKRPPDGGARRRGRAKADKAGGRSSRSSDNGHKSPWDARSGRSAPSSRSDGQHFLDGPSRARQRRSQTPDGYSVSSDARLKPDGAESLTSFRSGSPEKKGAPSVCVSRASVSSDHSRSEMDLSSAGAASEHSGDDSLSLRSRSVPGLRHADPEEDADPLLWAHQPPAGRRLSGAVSTSSMGSMTSMYSETGDDGHARVSGEILLNVSYSYKTGALDVLVKECHDLAVGDDKRQRTNAYVKTYLLPDTSRQSKRKTGVQANSVNPVFNENLRYVIGRSQLETRTLQVSVWHRDRLGRNAFLGQVELTFDSRELDCQMDEWMALRPKPEGHADADAAEYRGELTVVLKYIPAEKNLMLPLDQVQVKKGFLKAKKKSTFTPPRGGMVELLVKGASNLTGVKSGGTSDPFVKGYLLPDSRKSTKHKTAAERRTVHPRWNHTFTYCGLQPGDLDNVCLELTVWDKEPLASNVFLGGVRLGAGEGKSYGNKVDWMDSYGEERRVWRRMTDNPEVPQECTLMLRSTMGKAAVSTAAAAADEP
ncbi:synaptotagmin-like protein 5 isoform X2 [Stigmatopora nigra]